MELTIHDIKSKGWLIYEAITGSRAYGLATEGSDTDIRGVFVLPLDLYYSLDYIPQLSNDSNDIVYYELRRFIELLSKNNPNILEMLAIPSDMVLYRDELMNDVREKLFLSKLSEQTFANYAFTQVKKAYGLEKKILNPVEEVRKSILDFCYVYIGKGTMSLESFLKQEGLIKENIGLAAVPHMRDCYNMYSSSSLGYAGIMKKDSANDVSLSSIPKTEMPVGMLYFNKDGYSIYCRRHKEYWDWVQKRNGERYRNTMSHGKNYDSKNMMHVFRLLLMAKEIATEGTINVVRQDRDFLLGIKKGLYEYEMLVNMAVELKNELPSVFASSGLPEKPNLDTINELLVSMRKEYYGREKGI